VLAVVVGGAVSGPRAGLVTGWEWFPHGPLGVLQAAGLLFFAFAGFARIATLGEEVRDPERTIPRAIPLALGIVLVVYALVGTAALVAVGPAALAASPAPLVTAVGGDGPLAPLVRAGAALAAVGVLLSLLAGVARTVLAMARDRELPRGLAAVDPGRRVPQRAQVAIGAVVVALVLLVDLRDVIGFSGVAVLTYYAVAHASALTLPRGGWHSGVAAAGLVGCLVLAVTLPPADVVAGVGVLVAGVVGRAALARVRR
jgi:APA family basic amino acid/polyamine antiporter